MIQKNGKTNPLETLASGLFLMQEERKSRIPEKTHDVIDQMTSRGEFMTRMYRFVVEIRRNLSEMQMSIDFLKNAPVLKNSQEEDYIIYHQGYFLELVHSTKDMLFQIVDSFSKLKDAEYNPKPARNLKIRKILGRESLKKATVLSALFEEWEDEGNPLDIRIQSAIKMRTHHHHFFSPLVIQDGYLDVKAMSSILDIHKMKSLLSVKGVDMVTQKKEDGVQKLKEGGIRKMEDTLSAVEMNVYSVAKELLRLYNVPTFLSKKGKRTIYKSDYFIGKRDDPVPTLMTYQGTGSLYKITEKIKSEVLKEMEDKVTSIYVYGSVARGNAIPNKSDINLCIVTGNISLSEMSEMEIKFSELLIKLGIGNIDGVIVGEKDFLSIDNIVWAYACKIDGLLIYGGDLLKNKRFPKPGVGLAYVLNKDFPKMLTQTKLSLAKNPLMSLGEVNDIGKSFAKRILHMLFAEIMTNDCIYTPNLDLMKEIFISKKQLEGSCESAEEYLRFVSLVRNLYDIAKGTAIVNREGLENMVSGVDENLLPLWNLIEASAIIWAEGWEKMY